MGVVVLGVMPDHVCLFVKHGPKLSVSFVGNHLGCMSRVLRSEFGHLWSRLPMLWVSYFAVSVGADLVRWYIDTQWGRA